MQGKDAVADRERVDRRLKGGKSLLIMQRIRIKSNTCSRRIIGSDSSTRKQTGIIERKAMLLEFEFAC